MKRHIIASRETDDAASDTESVFEKGSNLSNNKSEAQSSNNKSEAQSSNSKSEAQSMQVRVNKKLRGLENLRQKIDLLEKDILSAKENILQERRKKKHHGTVELKRKMDATCNQKSKILERIMKQNSTLEAENNNLKHKIDQNRKDRLRWEELKKQSSDGVATQRNDLQSVLERSNELSKCISENKQAIADMLERGIQECAMDQCAELVNSEERLSEEMIQQLNAIGISNTDILDEEFAKQENEARVLNESALLMQKQNENLEREVQSMEDGLLKSKNDKTQHKDMKTKDMFHKREQLHTMGIKLDSSILSKRSSIQQTFVILTEIATLLRLQVPEITIGNCTSFINSIEDEVLQLVEVRLSTL